MLKVAITGNIAAGKSTVEDLLREKGFCVLDTDKVAHNILDSIKDELVEIFKPQNVTENGQISRKKIADIVFNNDEMKTKLENAVHPLVKQEIQKFFEQNEKQNILFVSIPQLFEANMENLFDKKILIFADDNIRTQRLIKRNHYDIETAQKRVSSQISQHTKLSRCEFVIKNNDTIDELKNNTNNVITHLLH